MSGFLGSTVNYLKEVIQNQKPVLQRALAYLFERYLGEYTNISHEQIKTTLSWNTQELTVENIELKPKAVSSALADFPCEVIEGYVGLLTASIPWTDLDNSPTPVLIKDVDITLRPKAPINKAAQLLEAMSSSVMHSMESSKMFAEEAIKTDTASANDSSDRHSGAESSNKIEAVEWMTSRLEKIKAMVHVIVENVTLRLEMVEDDKVVGLEIHIDKLEYFDDQVKGKNEVKEDKDGGRVGAWLTKNIHAVGITIRLDDRAVPFFSTMPDSTGTSPAEPLFVSAMESVMSDAGSMGQEEEGDLPRAVPITIASIAGKSEMKVKVKSKETVDGPKVDISNHLGPIHCLLSPKQLELLIKILTSYIRPPESESGSSSRGLISKPMGPEDYERVGQVLRRDMQQTGGVFEEVIEHMTDDSDLTASGERMFHTMETGHSPIADNVSMSSYSLDSAAAMSYRASKFGSPSSKGKSRESTVASDPSAERIQYQVTVSAVTVCLLHEELVRDANEATWKASMIDLSNTYFQGLRRVTTVGQVMSLADLRNNIADLVPRDHLGLLLKPISLSLSDRTIQNVQSVTAELTVHQGELVECLIDPRQHRPSFSDQEPVRVPQYCEILTFNSQQRDHSTEMKAAPSGSFSSPRPAIHLIAMVHTKTGPLGYAHKDTKVSVEVGSLVTEVDISIQDRLNTLLNSINRTRPPPTSQPLLSMDGTIGFDDAMQDVSQSPGALNISVLCPHVTVRVRFPVPDLRPCVEVPWGRDLHSESLLIEIDQLSLYRHIDLEKDASAPTSTEIMCRKLEGYLQEDINKPSILFGSIQQGTGDEGDNFNRPRVVIKSFPSTSTPLDALREEVPAESNWQSYADMQEEEFCWPQGSSPFSRNKEITYGIEAFENDDREGFDTKFERVSPGNKEEMKEFMDMASSNTSLLIDITVPKLMAILHNKDFLELLYNRINNDLLLWQPRRPSTPEAFTSVASINVQPFATLNSLNRSCYGSFPFETDPDSDDDLPPSPGPSNVQPAKYHLPSDLCISLSISDGKLFATVPVREEDGVKEREGVQGELALVTKDASLFVSVGHEGNKDLRYVTISANRAQLLHAGCVEKRPSVKMEHLDSLTLDSKQHFEHMHNLIYRSDRSVPIVPLTDVGNGDMSEDMLAIAIEIKVDNFNNSKYFCVAAGLRGATLQHEKYPTGEGWIPQVMDLVDLTDFPIKGYVMPKSLTDLHLGLTGCSVDYRPKNFRLMPLRSLLTIQKFNFAANLNAETKYTSLKFLFDEAQLWLSDKIKHTVDVNRDFICLARVALLEIGLRLGAASEGSSSKLLWLGNSKTELSMCSDSCAAFMHLLEHFMNDMDLDPQEEVPQPAEEELHIQKVPVEERTPAQNQHVEQMLSEALVELNPPDEAKDSAENLQEDCEQRFIFDDIDVNLDHFGTMKNPPEDVWGVKGGMDDLESFDVLDPSLSSTASSSGIKFNYLVEREAWPIHNHNFLTTMPTFTSAQDLKTPADYPQAVFKTVLREINLDVCIYGGYDFDHNKDYKEQRQTKVEETMRGISDDPNRKPSSKKLKGGVNRKEDVMVRLAVSKLRMQYEKYQEDEEKARRLVVVARQVEIEDHLAVSKFNKFMYWQQFNTSHEGANLVCLKLLWERPDPRYNTEECSVRLSLQPLKFHINQTTFIFIRDFFSHMAEDSMENPGELDPPSSSSSSSTLRTSHTKSTSLERAPIFSTAGSQAAEGEPLVGEDLMHFSDSSSSTEDSRPQEKPPRVDVDPEDIPTFFKCFVMSRPVNITVDYMGRGAGVNTRQKMTELATSALQGVLQLNDVQLSLKALDCHKGYLGLSRLMEAIVREWSKDISTRQLGAVVGGIGPLSILKNLVMGLLDFFILPYEQYQRDGRVWRGFQKGASSLKTATQTAFLDLLTKLIESIMVFSEICFDFLSSGKSIRSFHSKSVMRQPRDIREGMSGAVQVFHQGFTGTLTELVREVSQQREQKGLHAAVGSMVKAFPSAVLAPINVLSAGANQCVTGIRNEIRPELVKEMELKYKNTE